METELERAIDKVVNFLEVEPTLFGRWVMADINSLIRDIRQHGASKTGWPEYDLDILVKDIRIVFDRGLISKEIFYALNTIISHA